MVSFAIRPLLYEEKNLDYFDEKSGNPYFEYFYKILLTIDGTKVTDLNVEKNITELFNDSCYICTLALLVKRPELKLGYFRELSKGTCYSSKELRADVVLCMVYYMLKNYFVSKDMPGIQNLLSSIDTNLRERSSESTGIYNIFYDQCDSLELGIIPWFFDTRTIKRELLEDLNINWKDVTKDYNEKELKELICFWEDPHVRNIIIDNIEEAVKNEIFPDDLPF